MATERKASVTWQGDLMSGRGTIESVTSGVLGRLEVDWANRAEDAKENCPVSSALKGNVELELQATLR